MLASAQELADLVARVAARDRAAFKALYQATSAKLFGVIVRILSRRDLAEEVLQEVYITIWERAGAFDATRSSPITWMSTIARNRALDQVRRKMPASIEDAPEALEVAADTEHPLDRISRGEDWRRLQDCLGRLEPGRREMVLLAYHQGLSREALAQRFGSPVATIKTWLHRSLAQLRQCLGS